MKCIILPKFGGGYFFLKNKYGVIGKKVVLGVASVWDKRKGLDFFINLSSNVSSDIAIIVVGVTEEQANKLPHNIISITRTNNVNELRGLYSLADVFVNPTIEDNYPTTNLEAQCCLTPCLTYDTGGSPESVPKDNIVCKNDSMQMCSKLMVVNTIHRNNSFDKHHMVRKYLELYDEDFIYDECTVSV